MFKLEEGCVKSSEFLGDKQIFHIEFSRQTCTCPQCHSHTDQIKDYRQQEILLSWFNDVPVYASLRKRRYVCPACGHSFYAPQSLQKPNLVYGYMGFKEKEEHSRKVPLYYLNY